MKKSAIGFLAVLLVGCVPTKDSIRETQRYVLFRSVHDVGLLAACISQGWQTQLFADKPNYVINQVLPDKARTVYSYNNEVLADIEATKGNGAQVKFYLPLQKGQHAVQSESSYQIVQACLN